MYEVIEKYKEFEADLAVDIATAYFCDYLVEHGDNLSDMFELSKELFDNKGYVTSIKFSPSESTPTDELMALCEIVWPITEREYDAKNPSLQIYDAYSAMTIPFGITLYDTVNDTVTHKILGIYLEETHAGLSSFESTQFIWLDDFLADFCTADEKEAVLEAIADCEKAGFIQ